MLNDNQITERVAKLEGMVPCDKWTPLPLGLAGMYYQKGDCGHKENECYPFQPGYEPKYITSTDAIVAVILKQTKDIQIKIVKALYEEIYGFDARFNEVVMSWSVLADIFFTTTPRILCVTLLKAADQYYL